MSQDRQFHVVIDGFAFKGFLVSGLSRVDGKYADNNETTVKGEMLKNGIPGKIVCSVRKGKVWVTVDGKKIFEWAGDFKRLSNHPALRTKNPRALYINAYNCIYRFSKFELRPVSGPGERLR